MRGNILQIAAKIGNTYYTIAQATSQKLSVNNQTADLTTKDKSKAKEITGRSWSITTENLVCHMHGAVSSIHVGDLLDDYLTTGNTLDLRIINATPLSFDATDENEANNDIPTVIMSGTVRLVKLDLNFPNKENSSYTAEFQGVGPYSVSS